MLEETLRKMQVHDQIRIDDFISVLRVLDGWVYYKELTAYDEHYNHELSHTITSTFVKERKINEHL